MAKELKWMGLTNKAVGTILLVFGFLFFGQAWASGAISRMALPFILIVIGIWLLWPRNNSK